jgi:seryl-tRNA synthetase
MSEVQKHDWITSERLAWRDRLVADGLLIATPALGVYGRSSRFEDVLLAVSRGVHRLGDDQNAERVAFPPILPRVTYDASGHLSSMPELLGSVSAFTGNDRDHRTVLERQAHGESWSDDFTPTDVVLSPAACYPVYPMCTGQLPDEGRVFEIVGQCFRHEPSVDPMRQVTFRQHEFVCVASPEQVQTWRDVWFTRVPEYVEKLGVPFRVDVANDPFFGRTGRLMAASQREQALKFEVLVPTFGDEFETAVASLNAHRDHFTHSFGIEAASGEAHTACFGMGLERMTLAMFKFLGHDVSSWPSSVRTLLF